MKIAFFLFVLLMNCSTLFAYHVQVTKLTEENFDPLPTELRIFFFRTELRPDDKQIATMTLVFDPHEIGQDSDAVRKLAKKEAAKLGANDIFYISSTEYTDTKDIASMTFRCARFPDIDYDVDLFESSFYKNLYLEVLRRYEPSYFDSSVTLYKTLSLIGVKREQILKENKKITVLQDIKTNKQLDKDAVLKRWLDCYANEIISFYKENLDLYISEYDKIFQIIKKNFPKTDVEKVTWFHFPKLDAQKNINFENFKDFFTLNYKKTWPMAERLYDQCLLPDDVIQLLYE